ncbi:MAG: bifunctional class I SAM-dependent methyltransferase/HIT family protein [Candidatus Zhuqueibacterota bacterium]
MENIYQSPENPHSHLTVKQRDKVSFPTRNLFSKNLINGKTLDFGCGLGADVTFLKSNQIDVTGYDPYYLPKYPVDKFDTIICIYVLNVLLPIEQMNVLMAVSELLKPSGKAYFAVRRDLKKVGYRNHYIHKVKTYQCNVILPYKSILKTNFCEIYEYQHVNRLNSGLNNDCPFCNLSNQTKLITESATAYAIYDNYPVSKGHSLIIPKDHIPNYFDLSEHSKRACWLIVDRVKQKLDIKFKPNGYNIGININQEAGQTIHHVHIHLIPRYKNDVENPRGGVRHVIPGKGYY